MIEKLLNQMLKATSVNYALASTSRGPDRLKYYFSLCGKLPP
jgi:hypothetical protein